MSALTLILFISLLIATCFQFCIPSALAFQPRIEGGRPAQQGEAPYQLSIQIENGTHFCGASLIEVMGVQLAVSAAHCFPYYFGPVYLVAGDVVLNDTTGAEQRRLVTGIEIHPGFDETKVPQFAHDISLLFFDIPFQLNKNVSTIRLPKPGMKNIDGKIVVTGWGQFYLDGPLPSRLQLIEVDIYGDETCKLVWNSGYLQFIESMMCAGTTTGGLSPCRGDSGGPAVYKQSPYLLGVISFVSASGCGNPHYPAVYTEVAYYLKWIENTVVASQKLRKNLPFQ